ncbi:hypothetical protein CHS0354_010001 [Potamilus streckersoni]|uniref:Uncharacterized protein n=1 Tax=Potamilus streckersoni TaxID=2493646 RepID=A0AAE0SCH5_9BIVA|nr:hypothetical protein CHS0354_010001 [Potamilus streckersoni]
MQTNGFSRSSTMSGKRQSDDPPKPPVKFDYSEIYSENDELDLELDLTKTYINRAQYRARTDLDDNIKQVKKNAEGMKNLQEAIKNYDSKELCRNISRRDIKPVRKPNEETNGNTAASLETRTGSEEHIAREKRTENQKEDESNTKPKNTLTMFLMSLHRIQTAKQVKKHSVKEEENQSEESYPLRTQSTSIRSAAPGRSKSVCYGGPRADSLNVQIKGMRPRIVSSSTYNADKQHSRSRRQLETISKLEQSFKFDKPSVYEERRKTLLANSKENADLQRRVKIFLKNIDEFKSKSKTNSLEEMFSRGVYVTHSHTVLG